MASLSTALPFLGSHHRSEATSATTASPSARQGSSVRFADHVSITTISPATTDLTATSSDHATLEPSPMSSTSSMSQPTLESSRDVEMHYVVSLIKNRNLSEFKKWAREAPDVNLKDFAGNTPLHWACHKGMPEFVAVLLRRGAVLEAKNNNHATPLHCSAIAGVKSVIDILLQANADPSLRNKQGKTMFDLLRSKGHVHLDHAYEDLEDSVLARQAPHGAEAAGGDSWLDANRLGAESDTASSVDGIRPSLGVAHSSPGLAVGGPARRSASGSSASASAAPSHHGQSSSVVPLPPIYSMAAAATRGTPPSSSATSSHRGSLESGAPGSVTSPDTQAILRALERERLMLERRLQALEDRNNTTTSSRSSPAARPAQQHLPAPLRPSYLQLPQDSSVNSDGVAASSSYLVGNTTVPLIASPPTGAAGQSPSAERHTVPLVVKSGVSPRAVVDVLPPSSSQPSSSSFQSVSPQRYIGANGRILCSSCDDSSRALATHYCEECRRSGDACWLCDACWKSEHSSKRTRGHRSGPVPIPQLPSATPRASSGTPASSNLLMTSLLGGGSMDLDGLPFDLSSITPEARAYLMLQHQLIQALTAKVPASHATVSTASRSSARDDASRLGTPIHIGVQTQEPLQSAYFDEAMLELQDVREQLEAEVHHSQTLIDSTRLQLLEALELRHRSEIETMCWRKLLQVKRPPSVIVVYDATSIPPPFANLPRQEAGPAVTEAWLRDKARLVNRSSSPPSVQRTASPGIPRQHAITRRATNSQGVQCDAERFRLVPTAAHAACQTQHTGDETPQKSKDDGSFVPRYAPDAVEVVHGEKHLPDQPQMLLVRWTRGGLESWIPAYEVAHCDAVVAYMSRYDKSFNNSLMMLTGDGVAAGDDEPSPLQNRSVSPMNDTERTQLSQQLAALKRSGTAQGSRDSLREPSGQHALRGAAASDSAASLPHLSTASGAATSTTLNGGSAPSDKSVGASGTAGVLRGGAGRQPRRLRDSPLSDLPPSRGVLPSSFQPTQVVAVDDDDELPLPPTEGNKVIDDLRPDDDPSPPPQTPDDELVKKYELRLRELEAKQQELKALREVQVARIQDLRAKQQLMHEDKRADVRRQYDAKASQLQQSQPEKLHPLESTTDKHAALILEELNQEVLDAEKHKKDSKRPSPRSGPTHQHGLGKPPLPSKGPISPQKQAEQQAERQEQPLSGPPPAVPLPKREADALPAPGAPTFERKINRILYEQYFYNRAVAAQQQQHHQEALHDPHQRPRPLPFEPRPSSLN